MRRIISANGNGTLTSGNLVLHISVETDEDGMYVAQVAEFPGCVSQGGSRLEALAQLTGALAQHIAVVIGRAQPNLLAESVVVEGNGGSSNDTPEQKKKFELVLA